MPKNVNKVENTKVGAEIDSSNGHAAPAGVTTTVAAVVDVWRRAAAAVEVEEEGCSL